MLETRTHPLTDDRAAAQRAEPALRGDAGRSGPRSTELPPDQAATEANADRLQFSPEGLEALRREALPAAAPTAGEEPPARAVAEEVDPAPRVEPERPAPHVHMAEVEARRDLLQLRGQDLQVRARPRFDPLQAGEPGRLAPRVDYEMGTDGRRYAVGTERLEETESEDGPRLDERSAQAARTYTGAPREQHGEGALADFLA